MCKRATRLPAPPPPPPSGPKILNIFFSLEILNQMFSLEILDIFSLEILNKYFLWKSLTKYFLWKSLTIFSFYVWGFGGLGDLVRSWSNWQTCSNSWDLSIYGTSGSFGWLLKFRCSEFFFFATKSQISRFLTYPYVDLYVRTVNRNPAPSARGDNYVFIRVYMRTYVYRCVYTCV